MDSAVQVVKRFQLTKVGNRAVSTRGWRIDLAEEHLKWHLGQPPSKRWCATSCMAATFFGRNTEANRVAIRRRIARAFKALLDQGLFLVIEYDAAKDGHGKIVACKLFERVEGAEEQYAVMQLDRMKRHSHISQETWERAKDVICAVHSVETPAGDTTDGGE